MNLFIPSLSKSIFTGKGTEFIFFPLCIVSKNVMKASFIHFYSHRNYTKSGGNYWGNRGEFMRPSYFLIQYRVAWKTFYDLALLPVEIFYQSLGSDGLRLTSWLIFSEKLCEKSNSDNHLSIIHLVSTQNFPKKMLFLTPWYVHMPTRITGYKMLVFRKILRLY